MKGMKGLGDQLPDELSGTALWHSVSQRVRARDASDGPITTHVAYILTFIVNTC